MTKRSKFLMRFWVSQSLAFVFVFLIPLVGSTMISDAPLLNRILGFAIPAALLFALSVPWTMFWLRRVRRALEKAGLDLAALYEMPFKEMDETIRKALRGELGIKK